MIATMDHVKILDKSDVLVKVILDSEIMDAYNHAQTELQNDTDAQQLIQDFNEMKLHYEDVQRFGRYHPDYSEIMRSVRRVKRKMDMNDKVAAYKVAERDLQNLLDEVSELIAHSVSEHIKVPKDGAFLSDTSCGTGCGTGGSCGCQAS